ncbi:hypothetical protein ABL78_1810 [Leptomonas seymouri]|uniref:Organic solute transport protein 1 n=1 Tax=Leptomonas seymouri TaxID=5684 RepID=A0A0N1I1P0_LEPSE|nr:hypothetical protein ABL78_1810 [Leptomonas seymouri]|eukprot:KPI89074.1 hypothetical protein ABL78_1810 [Leptomonas seymouri]
MTQRSMPFLIFNLGVEMIFVLHSRLRAQDVPIDKAESIMCDIGSNLFSSTVVAELFTPQPVYTPASVKQVLSTLPNSSVMRLSENSMKKLYDLVFMTVKYQVLTLRHPLELYELTLNHLDAVLELVPTPARPLIAEATERVQRLADGFSMGDWADIRRSLLNFFGGRYVRVSVFLENNMQNAETGAFYIPKDAYLPPLPSCQPPGTVHLIGANAVGRFEHPDARLPYPPAIPVGQWDPRNCKTRMTTNGNDMYAAPKTTKAYSTDAAAGGGGNFSDPLGKQTLEIAPSHPAGLRAASSSRQGAHGGPVVSTSASAFSQAEREVAYHAEVNYLAKMAGAADRGLGVHAFELQLFAEAAGRAEANSVAAPSFAKAPVSSPPSSSCTSSDATLATRGPPPSAPAVPLSRMTANAMQEQNKKLLGIMRDFDAPKSHDGDGGGDASAMGTQHGGSNLLDIMDEI